MAKIELKLLNIFQMKLDKKSIEYEGKNVGSIITKFIQEYGDKLDDGLLDKKKKKLHSQMLILLNGRNILYLNKYKTKLKDGDVIYLSVPLAGG